MLKERNIHDSLSQINDLGGHVLLSNSRPLLTYKESKYKKSCLNKIFRQYDKEGFLWSDQ